MRDTRERNNHFPKLRARQFYTHFQVQNVARRKFVIFRIYLFFLRETTTSTTTNVIIGMDVALYRDMKILFTRYNVGTLKKFIGIVALYFALYFNAATSLKASNDEMTIINRTMSSLLRRNVRFRKCA